MKVFTLVVGLSVLGMSCGDKSSKSSSSSSSDKSDEVQSMALDSKDELPECKGSNKKQLAYIIDEDQFYVCNDEWETVDIQGHDAETLDDNHFLDKITGYLWQTGTTMDWATAQTACGGAWTVPTQDEALDVWKHGLNPSSGIWTDTEKTSTIAYYVNTSSLVSFGPKTTVHYSVCVRK